MGKKIRREAKAKRKCFERLNPRWKKKAQGCYGIPGVKGLSYYPNTGFLQFRGYKFWTKNAEKALNFLSDLNESELKEFSGLNFDQLLT